MTLDEAMALAKKNSPLPSGKPKPTSVPSPTWRATSERFSSETICWQRAENLTAVWQAQSWDCRFERFKVGWGW
jgi:hypothetical protein